MARRVTTAGEQHGWDRLTDAALLQLAQEQADRWDAQVASKQDARLEAWAELRIHRADCTDGCERIFPHAPVCPLHQRPDRCKGQTMVAWRYCAMAQVLQEHAAYRGAGSHKESKRPRRKSHAGGNIEVDALDRLQLRGWQNEQHADPPVAVEIDGKKYILGDDYSLPAWWYGGQASTIDALAEQQIYRVNRRGGERHSTHGPVTIMDAAGNVLETREKKRGGSKKGRKVGIGRTIEKRSALELFDAVAFVGADTRAHIAYQRIEE